ncbi:MAG: cell division protein ZapA [Pseudomonadota bacterium]
MTKPQVHRQVELNLGGQTIRLRSDADEAYLGRLASYVDRKITTISRQTRTVTSQRAALLAALDIADEFFRSRERAQGFRNEVRERSSRLLNLLESQASSAEESPAAVGTHT